MRCPNCKTELKQDDVYCYQCGTKINWFWRFKTHLIAVAVVMIVLAGGTITGVTLYRNGVFDAKKIRWQSSRRRHRHHRKRKVKQRKVPYKPQSLLQHRAS